MSRLRAKQLTIGLDSLSVHTVLLIENMESIFFPSQHDLLIWSRQIRCDCAVNVLDVNISKEQGQHQVVLLECQSHWLLTRIRSEDPSDSGLVLTSAVVSKEEELPEGTEVQAYSLVCKSIHFYIQHIDSVKGHLLQSCYWHLCWTDRLWHFICFYILKEMHEEPCWS